MRKVLLAGLFMVAAMPAFGQKYGQDHMPTGQEACEGKIYCWSANGCMTTPAPWMKREDLSIIKSITSGICTTWKFQQADADRKAARRKALDEFVPQYETLPDREWHVINQTVHGTTTVTVLQRYNIRYDPETGQVLGYQVNPTPTDQRIKLTKGAIFSVPAGTFDPASIETTGAFWGMTTYGAIGSGVVTFPTAAADPHPIECQADNHAYKAIEKHLLRCRLSADDEWENLEF